MSMSAGKSECGKRKPVQQHRALNMVVSVVLWCASQSLTKIENLDLPHLKELFLHQNAITKIEGLEGYVSFRVTAGARSVGSLLVIQGRLSIACRGCWVVGQVPALAAAVAVVEQDRAAGEPALPGVPP